MRLRHTILVALLLVVGTTSFSVKNAIGQTRLGLHVTQEELNVWKQRAASGPYRATGDVKSNSPGDWDKITANANSFLGNSSAQRWAGYTGAGCVPTDTSLGGILPNNGSWLQDAAFYYLVTGTLSYRTAVINELVAQAGVAGVNWANTAKWCIVAEDADNYFR